MSLGRAKIIARNIALGLAALLIISIAAFLIIVRTAWFSNFIREQIVSSTEAATGGKVDINSFTFQVSGLRAIVTGFVIHGNEPAGAAPLFRADRVEVDFRLFTSLHHLLDITSLAVDRPSANIMILPDGRTNIPSPKTSSDNTSALKTVVDLGIGHFEMRDGLITMESRKQPFDLRGNNLRAQLDFNTLTQSYRGQVSLDPLYVLAGRNTPVNFRITVPVTLGRDSIQVRNATVTSPRSAVSINGSLENIRSPKITVHVTGLIAVADLKNAGNLPLDLRTRNLPSQIVLDANGTVSSNLIQVSGLRAALGQSTIEASGTLRDPAGAGSLAMNANISLGEVGQFLNLDAKPRGSIVLNARARLDRNNAYRLDGNVEGSSISFQEGKRRIGNVSLSSALHFDPRNLELNGLRLDALGGEFDGNASLTDFTAYKLDGNLRHLDIRNALSAIGEQLPYDGAVSGPIAAAGSTKSPGLGSVMASGRLTVSPGSHGIPVSGRINAVYNGSADDLSIENSFLALPHSRIVVNGSVGKRLNVTLTTRDPAELLAAANLKRFPTITFDRGEAVFTGTVTGRLTSPRITGHLAASRFSAEGRRFDQFAADLTASSSGAAVSNGLLARDNMQAQFSGSVGLRGWAALAMEPVSADLTIRNADLSDAASLAGEPANRYSGALTASAHIGGTLGNPLGTANVQVGMGAILGYPFDQTQIQVSLTNQLVTVPVAFIQSGPARIELTGDYQHPRDSFTTGQLRVHVQSNQMNLGQVPAAQAHRTDVSGQLQLNADLVGTVEPAGFLLSSLNGDIAARGVRLRSQTYGDLMASARTANQTVTYNATSDFAGSNVKLNGSTRLAPDYPTDANATVANLPVERVLALVNRTDLPARGLLSGSFHFQGTEDNPEGSADLTLARGVLYGEPIDNLRLRASYLPRAIDVPQLELVSGPSRVDLTAHYDHPAGTLDRGAARFNLTSSRIDLSRIRNLQRIRPGLGGTLQVTASGAGEIGTATPRLLLTSLNANVSATNLSAQGKNLGNLTLKANTTGANRLDFALDSKLAGASIDGMGSALLSGNYPVNARLTFNNVLYTHMRDLLGSAGPSLFEGAIDGQVAVDGPALKPDQMRGSIQLTRVNLTSLPVPGARRSVAIVNQGPVAINLDAGTVRVQSAHLTGPGTDVQVTGSASLSGQTLNLALNANADLTLLTDFDRDIYSDGKVKISTLVQGSVSKPLVEGQLTLQNASFNYTGIGNGISNANGLIAFDGNTAVIRNLSGESGGGKVSLTGFAGYSNGIRFGLRASGNEVRITVQQGVSIVSRADIRLSGTSQNSTLAGTVTIDKVTYDPRSDIGSILTRAAPPVQSPSEASPLLENMRLDIRVRTSADLAVQASLAQNLQASADLRLQGTAAQPGVLGRVTINEGKLVFFGATYTIDTGSIGFYNPLRIEPVLDLSLKTQAQGVSVVLRVTGPIDNMNLSYTSDPPLQFQEIVSLLASGKTPTSDPTLLANNPQGPVQSTQQLGESAILSAAIADPVSSRLSRVFGVTQLRIDPSFTSGTQLPSTRLTLQQRITSNLTFTYTAAVDDPNGQIVRIEWAFNPRWSAVANRDQNGIFTVNFFYKREFR